MFFRLSSEAMIRACSVHPSGSDAKNWIKCIPSCRVLIIKLSTKSVRSPDSGDTFGFGGTLLDIGFLHRGSYASGVAFAPPLLN